MSRRKRHGAHDEEHENHERWLVTYADMLTLLMVLFIVMFAMSTVDANKFAQLKESLAGAFGGAQTLVTGGASPGVDNDGVSPSDVDLSSTDAGAGATEGGQGRTAAERKAAQDAAAVLKADRAKASKNQQAAEDEVERLTKLRKRMVAALKARKLEGEVQFAIDERGLVVRVLTSGVVFSGDSAVLRPEGQRILRALAPTLTAVPNSIEVSGHTNQLNVPTRNYPSSWELSTARASSVVRYLLGRHIEPGRMTAAGYADQRPLYPPSDPRAVTMNRRVEVVVLSDQPAEVRALLKQAAEGE